MNIIGGRLCRFIQMKTKKGTMKMIQKKSANVAGKLIQILLMSQCPLDLLQRVSVLYRGKEWYTAFIDGFDPISRRHRINYGETSQWIWTHKKNIKPLPSGVKILKHVESMRSEIKSKKKYVYCHRHLIQFLTNY
eukprot:607480_1